MGELHAVTDGVAEAGTVVATVGVGTTFGAMRLRDSLLSAQPVEKSAAAITPYRI
jgi:hypothetical protein